MRFRTAPAVAAAVLGLAVGVPAAALADSPGRPAPTVTQSASTFTVDLPGVGSLTFTVDPATGSVSGLVATADSGFTAGPPTVTDGGVQVSFTDAAGTPTVLQAEVKREDGTVRVKPEAEQDESLADDDSGDAHDGQAPASASAPGDRNEAGDNDQADTPEPQATPTSSSTTTTTVTGDSDSASTQSSSDGDGGGHDGGSGGQDGSGGHDGGGTDGGGTDGGGS